MESQLEKLLIANDTFAELEEALDGFCPFEAVGMVSQEVRHGAFLTYLLDPMRAHGFGDECLQALMSAAAEAARGTSTEITPLDAYLMSFVGAKVRQWRNVDILVEVPSQKVIIAIELKIDAREHSSQLSRYKKMVEAEWQAPDWRHVFVFLTKQGDEPSDDDGQGWCSVELETLVCGLERVVRRGAGADAPRALLQAYLGMLRRLHLGDERTEKLARDLWAQHREALEFLADRRPDELNDAMAILLHKKNEIAAFLSKATKLTIVVDDCTPSCLRLAVSDWDNFDGMRSAEGWTSSKRIVLAELRVWPARSAAVLLMLGNGDDKKRNQIYDKFRSGGAPIKMPGKLSEKWKRMVSKTIINLNKEKDLDSEKFAQKIEKESIDFLADNIKQFDKALRS